MSHLIEEKQNKKSDFFIFFCYYINFVNNSKREITALQENKTTEKSEQMPTFSGILRVMLFSIYSKRLVKFISTWRKISSKSRVVINKH